MESAVERCFRAVPLESLSALAPRAGIVALRCHLTGCMACADFDADGRAAFEDRLRNEHDGRVTVRSWSCDDAHQRDLARAAGVSSLPAYVLVSADGSVSVREVV